MFVSTFVADWTQSTFVSSPLWLIGLKAPTKVETANVCNVSRYFCCFLKCYQNASHLCFCGNQFGFVVISMCLGYNAAVWYCMYFVHFVTEVNLYALHSKFSFLVIIKCLKISYL